MTLEPTKQAMLDFLDRSIQKQIEILDDLLEEIKKDVSNEIMGFHMSDAFKAIDDTWGVIRILRNKKKEILKDVI